MPKDDARGGADHRVTVPLLALVLFAAVTALRFGTGAGGSDEITLLFSLPIALLAVSYGWRAGLPAAALATALFALWAELEAVDVGAVGYLTRASAFVVLGGVVGAVVDDRARIRAADTRWFDMSNDLTVEASLDGYFTRLNERWERCLGWSREELMSRPMLDFVHPDDVEATQAVARALEERPDEIVGFENRYRTKDGSYRWLLWNSRSDEHRKYAVARDITERKQLEHDRQELLEQVEAIARTDQLTGLPNRRSWEEEVSQAIARARRHGRPLVLGMADLDHFKRYNDAHGHQAGDALLAGVAVSWRHALRATDFLARYGGEEFALLLPDCAPDEAVRLLDRLRAATPEQQTCSVGLAHWDGVETGEALVARADRALYEAKRSGRDRVVVSG